MPVSETEIPGAIQHGSAWLLLARLKRFQPLIVSVLSGIATVGALAVALHQFNQQGAGVPMIALVSSGWEFWLAFVAMMFVEPLAGCWIARQSLGIGMESLGPLLRKQALNMLLFSCAGDALFLAWLQKHLDDAKAAFALVCDMAIVSALVNNIATLGLLFLMRGPLQALIGARLDDRAVALAVALAAVPLVLMALRQRLMRSVGVPTMIVALSARTVVHSLLSIATWHFALPMVPLQSWFMLIAARMIFSRLPILPNKDLAFAAVVAILLGPTQQIGSVVAGVALLTLAADALLLLVAPSVTLSRRLGLLGAAEVPLRATEATQPQPALPPDVAGEHRPESVPPGRPALA